MTLNLNTLYEDQVKIFNLTNIKLTNAYRSLNEQCINSLLYIITYLEFNGYTLTHICLNDFKVFNQYLFLMRDQNIVKLENNMYEYRATKKDGIEFIPSNISKKNHKSMLYNSIGLFMFYIITKEVKHNLKEKELDKIYYSKPYFFIKNIMGKEPCLIYL
jgi:hypothetical protein